MLQNNTKFLLDVSDKSDDETRAALQGC